MSSKLVGLDFAHQDPLKLYLSSTLELPPRFQIVLPPEEWLLGFSPEKHLITQRIHNTSLHKEYLTRLRNSHDIFLSLIKNINYNVQSQTSQTQSSFNLPNNVQKCSTFSPKKISLNIRTSMADCARNYL